MTPSAVIEFIIIATFFGVAIYLLVQWLVYTSKGKLSKLWPTTEGEILVSRKKSIFNGEVPDFTYDIEYEYEVEGKKYVSNKIFYRSYINLPSEYHKKYPVGLRVVAHYNPNNPKEAVLETGIKPGVHQFLIGAIFLLLFSLLLFVLHFYPVYIQG